MAFLLLLLRKREINNERMKRVTFIYIHFHSLILSFYQHEGIIVIFAFSSIKSYNYGYE